MIDLQPDSAEAELTPSPNLPARLPWVAPRLDSVPFQDAQAGAFSGGITDAAGTAS